jgi:hypothetical protein
LHRRPYHHFNNQGDAFFNGFLIRDITINPSSMHLLNFPEFRFRIVDKENQKLIFDPIRKKYVALTPEEWVRQHVLLYLTEVKAVPSSMIGVEKQILLFGLSKRFDVVVFSNTGSPVLLVECKAPSVIITEKTFDQAARYNMRLRVKHFLITNGLEHFCCRIDYENSKYTFLPEILSYAEMIL